jgi:lysophospholipase L1-like esterase
VSRNVRSKSRVILSLLSIGITTYCVLFGQQTVGAIDMSTDDAMPGWSWTQHKPYVFDSSAVSQVESLKMCPQSYQLRTIMGEIGDKEVCMSDGAKARFASYFNGSELHFAAGKGIDNMLYGLAGVPCSAYDACMYVPESDLLITYQYLVSRFPSLVIYKNFSKRISPSLTFEAAIPGFFGYTFDMTHPDYIFTTESGYAWPVNGFAASNNGKWVAVSIAEKGYGLLDVETMQMKRISNDSLRYGRGLDPHIEMAVSNNGRSVAVMGMNASFKMFEVDQGCGDIPTDFTVGYLIPLDNECQVVDIRESDIITHFIRATHPRFNDDSAELSLYASSYTEPARAVVFRAHGYVSPRLDYLAMGDSFSSGEGDTEAANYLPGTNDKYEKCHVSQRSYPFHVAAFFQIEPQYVRSVACSGATMDDVVGSENRYRGQRERLGQDGRNLSVDQLILNKDESVYKFIPGRIHQAGFVSYYNPKIITIGIGGNDAAFLEKLKPCVTSPGACEWTTQQGRLNMALEIKNLFTKMVNTYTEIHKQSPKSLIYVIGYPKIINNSNICTPNVGMLSSDERLFMNESITYINQVIKAAAQKAGVRYISIESSIGNGVLCGTSAPFGVNGILFKNAQQLQSSTKLSVIQPESFHPNSLGQQQMAINIFNHAPGFTYQKWCESDEVVCPVDTVAPEPSSYWTGDKQLSDANLQHYVSYTRGENDQRIRTISVPEYSFKPGTTVRAELHSNPYVLGEYIVGTSGDLRTTVQLPDSVAEGYHTLHLYGTSDAGNLVDLYDILAFTTGDGDVTATDSQAESNIGGSPEGTDGTASISAISSERLGQNNNIRSPNSPVLSDKKSDASQQPKITSSSSGVIEPVYAIPGLTVVLAGVLYSVYARMRRNR